MIAISDVLCFHVVIFSLSINIISKTRDKLSLLKQRRDIVSVTLQSHYNNKVLPPTY